MECKNPSSSDSVSLCPALRPPLLEIVNTLLALVVRSCLLVGVDMRPGLGQTEPEKTGFPRLKWPWKRKQLYPIPDYPEN